MQASQVLSHGGHIKLTTLLSNKLHNVCAVFLPRKALLTLGDTGFYLELVTQTLFAHLIKIFLIKHIVYTV